MTARRLHEHLVEERPDDGVVVLRIEREDALGALSRGLVVRMGEYFTSLHHDTRTRVLIVTGTGRSFVAGADIAEYASASPEEFDEYQRLSRRTFTALSRLPQLSIAAVNGFALGGGMELALCCDLIVASERAKFGLPEVKLGLIPGGGGTQRLARAVGTRLTKEMIATGRFYAAADLAALGLVSGVWPPEELMSEALELARSVVGNGPLAVQAAKWVIDHGAEVPLETGLDLEHEALSALFQTDDGAEGIAAFLAKRAPTFHGK